MKDESTHTHQKGIHQFLSGGGKMADTIRSKDWSRTPLGPIDKWSQSLRTTVSLCLASNFPINIIWGKDRNQIYNDGYWPLCGDKHPHSMGQDFKECWFSAWDALDEAFESASNGETRFLVNQRMFLDRYGYLEETFFTFSFSPIRGESGNVEGLFHPVTELTQQTLVERRLNIVRDLADRTADASSVNEAAELITQTLSKYALDLPFVLFYLINEDGSVAELVGNTGIEAGTPASQTNVPLESIKQDAWAMREVLLTRQVKTVHDIEAIIGSGSCGPYPEPPGSALIIPISVSGVKVPLAVIIAGVSARRDLDEPYRNFYDLLSSTVCNAITNARSYEEERKRAEALAQIDKAKTVFFSNISHEFRTPLTLILGSLEEMQKRPDALGEENKVMVETTHRNAMRLLRLVNNLLDFSRIESGRMKAQYQRIDIASYTTELASNFRSAIEKAGLRFELQVHPVSAQVFVDKDMWEKVVMNLLSNAFKYTLKGEISVLLIEEDKNVILKVTDTGVGISAEELPKIFQRFHRVQNAGGRTFEGTGIGLSLVKELVQLHGGDVSVNSQVGVGTEFTVAIRSGRSHLPADQVKELELESDVNVEPSDTFIESDILSELSGVPAAEREGNLPVVLVVDDNADMRQYFFSLLKKDYYVITAGNGQDALNKIKSDIPDLIVSDIMMPEMDGIQLLQAVKNDHRWRNIPLILVSARAGEEATIEGYNIGADDYLVKPFFAKELLARVRSQINISQRHILEEEKIRRFFMQAPVAIAVVSGPEHVFRIANPVYQKLLGRTEGELIGHSIREVWPELEGQQLYELFDRVFQSGESFVAHEFPATFVDRGTPRSGYFDFVAQPVKGKDGNVTDIMIHATEVTVQLEAKKKIEESERRFRNVVQMSPNPMLILKGEDLILEMANDALFKAWNVGKEAFGKRFVEILPEMKGQPFEDLLLEVLRNGVTMFGHETPAHFTRKGGIVETLYFNFVYQPYREIGGEVSGVLVIAADVTAQVTARAKIEQSEEKYRSLSEKLEFQVAQRTSELKRSNEDLEQFAHVTSHDLKEPVRKLKIFSSRLELELGDELSSRAKEYLNKMGSAADRIYSMIDGLLFHSSIDAGDLMLENIELNTLMRAVETDLEIVVHQKNAVILYRDLPRIRGSAVLIYQLLFNLVSNSLKFSKADVSVVIELRSTSAVTPESSSENGPHVELVLEDNGIGFEQGQAENIFKSFVQLNAKDKYAGTGLGLYLCKRIVERHGGTIEAKSKKGDGARFIFTLPLASAEDPLKKTN